MASPSNTPKAPSPPPGGQGPSKMERRMSHFKEYKFFRSFSAKVENWPMRKAEQLWRKMRERKIAVIGFTPFCKNQVLIRSRRSEGLGGFPDHP
ncbi:hypothetical protein EVAR_94119_1 [Eumeta japonica]|uniref:Uncharacterized protein n=1 Tax=Eumeta variegata TaxID=151549 RepID=A0A4C1U743_EUMVA|nr:hypothetical protein EVAR_94119_1 [Eumeta japonica]